MDFIPISDKEKDNYKMINIPNDNISRELILTCAIEFFDIVKGSVFWEYSCSNRVLIRREPELRIPNELTENELNIVILQLLNISRKNICHGSESLNHLFITRCPSFEQKLSSVKINSNIMCILEPTNNTSLLIDGYKHNVFIPPLYFDKNLDKKLSVDVYYNTSNKNKNAFEIDFPLIEETKRHIVPFIYCDSNFFEYREKIGVNIFKEGSVYVWIIAFLCNKKLFDLININLLNKLFFKNDIEQIRDECRRKHSKKYVSFEEIKELCCNLNFKMKVGILDKISKYLISVI